MAECPTARALHDCCLTKISLSDEIRHLHGQYLLAAQISVINDEFHVLITKDENRWAWLRLLLRLANCIMTQGNKHGWLLLFYRVENKWVEPVSNVPLPIPIPFSKRILFHLLVEPNGSPKTPPFLFFWYSWSITIWIPLCKVGNRRRKR